ncbi:glycosyltransferase [Desulfovibrio sp. Huiquan2017]|uniref:glycosyltransferase n=1 Tax=Desulfovibrio sp. Huiquan2017 TaxID=2816861 RepID=UPI001A92DA19|nr:glycosyltransferase [Desulfovibrio sp. Huiquan2017]
MSKKSVLRDLFRLLRELDQNLLDLRLKALPQPALLMLLERRTELHTAMRLSAKKLYQRKHRAEERGWKEPLQNAKQSLAALHPIFKRMCAIHKDVNADLSTADACIHYKDLPVMVQVLKQRLRALGADTEKKMGALSPEQVFKDKIDGINGITRQIGQLTNVINKLNQWADAKIADHCAEFSAIFTQLETDPVLADVHRDVVIALRGIAYKSIAASGLFDEPFYLSQLPDGGKDIRDGLKNYLMQTHDAPPCRFFSDTYYRQQSSFVEKLRYYPLEHFARYGELMRLSPGPELDMLFYLKSNEDVLNAGVSPYRHFVHHGVAEGRPPSAHAGDFLSREYMDSTAGRLAFVGDPENEERLAWEVLRSRCQERENGHVVSFPVAQWDDHEDSFDGVVVGASALSALDGTRLSALARSGASLVYLGGNPQEDLRELLAQSTFPLTKVCAITNNYERFLRWQESEVPLRLLYYPFKNMEDSRPLADAVLSRLGRREEAVLRRFVEPAKNDDGGPKPVISVVSIIYKKPDEMLAFLESINRQDIARPYEVVLVDDASPDDTVDRVNAWLKGKRDSGLLNCHMDVRILCNETNSGNCISRNKGIEAARAEIVLVADGDMAFGSSNLSEHARAYRFGDCDAVLGFFRFDLNKEFIFDWLAACEIDHEIINKKLLNLKSLLTAYGNLQFLGHGVFNYVTRNLSFRKGVIKEEYFDPDFSYSTKPDSGYGGEDQEFGAKVYLAGGKTRFAERAIAIHTRHADNSYNDSKVLANLRNWEKLLAKHPDLALVDRQFYQGNTAELLDRVSSRREAPEYIAAHARYTAPERANIQIRPSRPLRILTYKWHAAHQYELFKMGRHSFTLATNIGTRHCNRWEYDQRPLPRNVRFAPLEAINPNEYDLAILPFDEHVLYPEHCGMHLPEWGNAFLTMLEATKGIPQVALCHGSPQIYEDEATADAGHTRGEVITGSREALRELLGDVHVVCNSHQAQREWNFANSSVIWHGFSPTEFPPGRHDRLAALTLSRKAFDSLPIKRGAAYLDHISASVGADKIAFSQSPPPHPGYEMQTQEWALAKFQNYTAYIGEFAAYLNTTVGAPMPRSRGEAMMTGTVPVSLRNHDVDMFIQNGVNGFYGDSAEELAEQLAWLLSHEKERRTMCRQARLTAMDIFNIDRYLSAWSDLATQMV